MNRCVRVIDQDGLSILPSASRVVKIQETDTFRDVLAKLVPVRNLPVTCVQLKEAVNTPDADLTDTQELDEKVSDVLQLVSSCHSFDPMIITYAIDVSVGFRSTDQAAAIAGVIAPQTEAEAEEVSTDDQLQDSDAAADKCISSGGTAVGTAVDVQHQCFTRDGVPHMNSDQWRVARSEVLAYMEEHGCSFHADDARSAVTIVNAVAAVMVNVSTGLLHSLDLKCKVAESQLLKIAAAQNAISNILLQSGNLQQPKSAILQAINRLRTCPATHRYPPRHMSHSLLTANKRAVMQL